MFQNPHLIISPFVAADDATLFFLSFYAMMFCLSCFGLMRVEKLLRGV